MTYSEFKALEGQTLTLNELMDVTGDINTPYELVELGYIESCAGDARLYADIIKACEQNYVMGSELGTASILKVTQVDKI